jgi:NAD(P)-dependent dehydrogenase (short-subunit alcohol dehydrogenase family)
VQLDVTDDVSVETALAGIAEHEGHLDVLVNNAGISSAADVTGPVALKVFDTNTIGLIRVTQAALPLLEQSENPVVVNVSSALGSFGRLPIRNGASFTSQASSMALASPRSRCLLFSTQKHFQESSSTLSNPASLLPTSLRSVGRGSR